MKKVLASAVITNSDFPSFIVNILIILELKVKGVKVEQQQWQESKQKILFKSKDREMVFI